MLIVKPVRPNPNVFLFIFPREKSVTAPGSDHPRASNTVHASSQHAPSYPSLSKLPFCSVLTIAITCPTSASNFPRKTRLKI